MVSKWLRNPFDPNERVLVARSVLGWIFKRNHFVSRQEIATYRLWQVANRRGKA